VAKLFNNFSCVEKVIFSPKLNQSLYLLVVKFSFEVVLPLLLFQSLYSSSNVPEATYAELIDKNTTIIIKYFMV